MSNFKLALSSAAFFSLVAAPCFAADWQATNDKGLSVYSIGNPASGQIKLVCDPENLWAAEGVKTSPQFYMLSTLHNQAVKGERTSIVVDGRELVFASPGGSVSVSGGKEEWNKLVDAISAQGSFSVKSGNDTFSLTVDRALESRCHVPVN